MSGVFDRPDTQDRCSQETLMIIPGGSRRTSTYWSRPHLVETLLDAVATLGLDLGSATPDELAPLDQFHGGGKAVTRALARQAAVTAGMRVLDVGGGLGGPARMLAVECGARVTVLDLTAEYLQVGALLTARMGLAGQVNFTQGDALDLPFADGRFDLVWTQNSGMQMADKARLYRGFFRVLRPGGLLAQSEPVAGPVQPPHFPLMWAREAADSHLLSADALRAIMLASGFIERYWNPAVVPEPVGRPADTAITIQRLIMGERLAAIQEAQTRNAAEGRLHSVLAVFERP
jgi:ubiquinone/menaquinone biosynthesis C-methylase UbiE